MAKKSAGILLYRGKNEGWEVLLVHPGGPFFVKKDAGAWSIPKGEPDDREELLAAALREFKEELGKTLSGEMINLTPVVQKGGKSVFAWAKEGDFDTSSFTCNTFTIEWPPRSGKFKDFPEIDKVEWFPLEVAMEKINPAQRAFIDELISHLSALK